MFIFLQKIIKMNTVNGFSLFSVKKFFAPWEKW